jgi:hypothetical protein
MTTQIEVAKRQEREACARLVESVAARLEKEWLRSGENHVRRIAAAIRRRSDKDEADSSPDEIDDGA